MCGGKSMPSKNTFSRHGDEIHIFREEWDAVALTTYREDYFDELTSVTWTESRGYLTNGKLGALHRYIMGKWYGEEMLSELTNQGWVVDHMNNDGFDCRISNLEFLPTRHNVAKGQTVDVESETMRQHIALTMCKDFSTGYYQIHIGCNDPISICNTVTGEIRPLAKLKLLYDCDYRIVINDARDILLNYDLYGKFNIEKLHCVDWKPEFCELIIPTEEEIGRPFIERDGKMYACIGNHIWFHSSSVENGWIPPEQ